MATSPKILVYIAGYGRSGSTLLDTVLSSHPQLEGVGEIKYLFQEVLDQKKLPAIWPAVLDEFSAQSDCSIEEANRLTHQVQTPFRSSSASDQEAFKKLWTIVLDSLHQKLPGTILVDSSKTAVDAFMRPKLLEEMGYELRMIHLVRSPKAVMFSLGKKGSNRLLEAGKKGKEAVLTGGSLRALLNWTWINLGVWWYYRRRRKVKIYTLRYEDLIEDTAHRLGEIANFIGIDPEPFQGVEEGFEVTPGIGVSGNRMRRASQKITFRKDTAVDYTFSIAEKIGLLLARPVRRLFKY